MAIASGSVFPVGTNQVVYVATDLAGNTATCSFTVVVLDSVAPVIVCPAAINFTTNSGTCGAVVTYPNASATDNCGSVTAQIAGLGSGSVFPVGVTTNEFLATDGSGWTSTCAFTVTVVDAIACGDLPGGYDAAQ
ncbi:MAG: HYR domain-containing protein [Bacteroidia bacterium]